MIRSRDRDAEFREFFLAESDRLRRFAAFLTGDADSAADLAQEALARTYRQWNRIRNEDPGPYARRCIVNLVRSNHRRALLALRHQRQTRDVEESPSGRVDEWMRVSRALRQLSPIRRATVVLRFYEDLSEAEIARVLDRPVGTVKSDLHRGLAKLRTLLEQPEKEPV